MSDGSPSTDETLVGDETLAPGPARRREPTTLPRGSTIGRYVVLECIGRGGMGIVHAAYDPELDRKVAVKVLVPRGSEEADAAAHQRLLREAQAMARVTHPNVVAVHDVGVHSGRVFVAMEFVDGSTLGRWLASEARTTAEIVAVFVQAGRGLAAAHAKDLVHRDFKPDNVMVSQGDAGPRAQVMDFGLVRAMTSEGPEEVETASDDERAAVPGPANRLTRLGQIVGTPAFMAPEQYEPGPIDARTDQFAFCVALWEAVFGAHPYGGGDPAEVAMRVARGERPDPPPTARAHASLRAALDRGLLVDRTQRWPSMHELLDELARDRSRGRRRALIGVTGVAALGLLVGGERLWHARALAGCEREGASIDETWDDPARERVRRGMLATELARAADSHARMVPWLDRHTQAWREARTEACVAGEVDGTWPAARLGPTLDCLEDQRSELSALLDVLAAADRETVDQAVILAADLPPPALCVEERGSTHQASPPTSPEGRTEHDALRAGLARAGALYATRRLVDARALLAELRPRVEATGPGSLYIRLLRREAELEDAEGHFAIAETKQREAFAQALELGAADLAAEAAEQLTGSTGLRLGRPAEGLWWADVAAGLHRRLGHEDDDVGTTGLLRKRAGLRQLRGEFAEALVLAERALASDEANLGLDHPHVGFDLQRLAVIHMDLGAYETAEGLARRSVEQLESSLGAGNPELAAIHDVVGDIARQLGRTDEALREHERALAIAEAALPADHPDLARSLANLGLALQQLGRAEQALPLLQRAIAITERALGSDHLDLARLLVNLGNVQQSQGELETALATYQRALVIVAATLGPDHPTKGVLLSNVGNTEMLLGRHPQAVVHLEQALAIIEASHGLEHANVGIVLINLANAYRRLDRFDDAAASDRRSLKVLEAAFGGQHPDVAYPLIGLALTELELERPEVARPLAERALAIRTAQPVTDQDLGLAQLTLARALEAEDPARARGLAQQALIALEGEESEARAARDLLARLEHEDRGGPRGGSPSR